MFTPLIQTPELLLGHQRLLAVIQRIKADPSCWDQSSWHSYCDTSHCIAGHGQLDSGCPQDEVFVRRDARIWFRLNNAEADYLFKGTRTFAEIETFVSTRFDYDRAGFDIDGFDRNGHTADLFPVDSYDSCGFNKEGFDREGFDPYGYDRYGYDRDGLDEDGLNIDFNCTPANSN